MPAAGKRYERRLTALGFLWALPISLVGIILGVLSASPVTFKDGMMVFRGDRGLAYLLLTRRGFAAMTLGRVVLATKRLSMSLWMHELEHARQAERWGLFYIPAYLVLQFRYGYWKNPFENAARKVEEEFKADRPQEADFIAV